MKSAQRFLLKRFFKDIIAMRPRAKMYGLKYFWDKAFRHKCKNREKTLKNRVTYRSYENNRKSLKDALYKKGKYCFWCGKFIKYKSATIDHIIPVSKGGGNKLNNLRLIHNHCRVERDRLINKGLLKIE